MSQREHDLTKGNAEVYGKLIREAQKRGDLAEVERLEKAQHGAAAGVDKLLDSNGPKRPEEST